MKKFLATILSVILLLTIIPMAYAENAEYKVGDIIQFGSYPQSEVKDEALIAELNALAPEWEEWTSYGYYSGNGDYGSMVQGDWMRYTDITYNGSKYRGVKFTQYRPYAITSIQLADFSYQDDNGYTINSTYWFKYEPLNWKILDPNTGLILCESIIDSQAYNNSFYQKNNTDDSEQYSGYSDSSHTNYANDYEKSSIRIWLNFDFYNDAFSNTDKAEIEISTLNNDSYYTLNGFSGYEHLNSNITQDRIFLLSYDETRNESFGFASKKYENDKSRIAKGSDYSKCQGLLVYRNSNIEYDGNSSWLLRSPGGYSGMNSIVDEFGYSDDYYFAYWTCFGVRPALRLADISKFRHQHSYTSTITTPATHLTEGVKTYTCSCGDTYTESIQKLEGHTYDKAVTAPTCTAQGYTTYTCACGDSYVADYVNVLGHKDDNNDYKCDYNCGYEYEKPAPENPDTPEDLSKDCSCNCHKGGFMGFIWKIINFFNKLFKSNQTCACGAKHW